MVLWSACLGIWAKSNLDILQHQQNLILRRITGVPYYISNETLHTVLQLEFIAD